MRPLLHQLRRPQARHGAWDVGERRRRALSDRADGAAVDRDHPVRVRSPLIGIAGQGIKFTDPAGGDPGAATGTRGIVGLPSDGRASAVIDNRRKGIMPTTTRCKPAVLALLATVSLIMALSVATADASVRTAAGPAAAGSPTIKRFSLAGYVLNTRYTQGRNTGNTFQQTYKASTVHGVPIAGPNVGAKFPVEDYVAMPIGNH